MRERLKTRSRREIPAVGKILDALDDDDLATASKLPRPLVVDLVIKPQVGMRLRRQQAERVQFGFEISKLPEQIEDAFAFVVFDDCRGRAPAGISSWSRHNKVYIE